MIPTTAQALSASYDPFAPEALENPYPYYAALRTLAPCCYLEKYDVYFVSRYRDVVAALKNWQTFSSSEGGGLWRARNYFEGGVILSTDPPEHTRIRRAVARDFTPRTVAQLEGRVREVTSRLIDVALEKGTGDIVSLLAEPLPAIIMSELLGLPGQHQDAYLHWSDTGFNMLGAHGAELMAGVQGFNEELTTFIHSLASEGGYIPGGLADSLFKSVGTADLSFEEAGSLVFGLIVAGMDTTVNLIGNMIYNLIEYPGQWEKLRNDPGLAASTVEEALRFEAPVQPGFFRTTTQEVDVAGTRIPAGARVQFGFGSANRDPEQFSQADQFLIDRTPNEHLAFGSGVHTCLGAPLSRLEGRIVLELLLQNVRSMSLAGVPKRRANKMVRGFRELPVTFQAV
jgi:cytochrome P450